MRRISGKVKRVISLVLVMILLISAQTVYAVDEYGQDVSQQEQTALTEKEPSDDEDAQKSEVKSSDQMEEKSQKRESVKTEEDQEKEAESQESYDGKNQEDGQAFTQDPVDESLSGETLKFVNLYWETQEIGQIQAVFDGGTGEALTVSMEKGHRGVYQTLLPEGDYSRVTFRKSDGEILGGSWNYYGQETSLEDTQSVAFQPEWYNCFYYDMGENPSWWGAQPDYETTESPQTYSLNSRVANQESLAGKQIYFTDMLTKNGEKRTNGDVSRVEAQLLTTSAGGGESIKYTMYENRTGIYTFAFPAVIDEVSGSGYKYNEITFKTYGANGSNPYELGCYYNFRGEKNSTNAVHYGSFQYQAGILDNYCFNEDYSDSYWDAHPSQSDVSLSGTAVYFDTRDNVNVNQIYADPDSIYLDWTGSPGEVLNSKGEVNENYEYIEGKGYHIKNATLVDGVRYFRFPEKSGATENTVFTLYFRVQNEKNPDESYEMAFRFLYVQRNNYNMARLDAIKEETEEIWTTFEYPQDVETRAVSYDNLLTSNFKTIQARFKQGEGDTPATQQTIQDQWNLEGYTVSEDGWITLKATAEEEVVDNPTLANKWGVEGVPIAYEYIQFRGTSKESATENPEDYNYSQWEEIDTSYNYPCFTGYTDLVYSKKGDPETWPEEEQGTNPIKANEYGNDNDDYTLRYLSGNWHSVLTTNNTGDLSANIPTGTFVNDEDAYYVTTSFYDYYSNWEMSGRKQADNTYKANKYHKDQGLIFNYAVSEYFKEMAGTLGLSSNAVKPIYFGDSIGSNGILDVKSYLYGWDNQTNTWTGSGSGPRENLVDDTLKDGNLTVSGIEAPYFDEDFVRGDNALGTAVGNVYKNISFPFKKNTEGYWEFDSSQKEQSLRLYQDVDEGYYLERTGKNVAGGGGGGSSALTSMFLPYSDDTYNDLSNSDRAGHIDYMFGNRFDVDFTLPENGEVDMKGDGTKSPVTFEFSGDDDAWIFVDGQLVLDIGGIHDAVSGTINFKDKTFEIRRNLNSNGGEGTLYKEGTFNLDESKSTHTLTMFYFERGLVESNLKLTFNFPQQNKLCVSKEVEIPEDTNPIFADALKNIGSFDISIQNLATSGESLAVEDSAGYKELGESKAVFQSKNGETPDYRVGSSGIQKVELTDKNTLKVTQEKGFDGSVPDASQLLEIGIPGEEGYDLTDMAYLRMQIRNGTSNNRAAQLHVELVDAKGNRAYGRANLLGYQESILFLSGYDSVMQVDLDKLTKSSDFDISQVTAVRLGLKNATNGLGSEQGYYEISDLTFFATWDSVLSQGFSTDQSNVSDYGSIASGEYEPATGAWYTKYTKNQSGSSEAESEEAASGMVENGVFALEDGQTVEFTDKFRVGSYISLEELVDTDVFDVSWSIRESGEAVDRNSLLETRNDVETVINPEESQLPADTDTPLEDRTGDVTDGRTAVNDKNIENPGVGFVYRGYLYPDNEMNLPLDLDVIFTNTLKNGSIRIEKQLASSMADTEGKYQPGTYTFDIYYTDVAGRSLETYLEDKGDGSYYIHQVVEITTDENGYGYVDIEGIPAKTQYYIQERPSGGAKLVGLEVMDSSTHQATVEGVDQSATTAEDQFRDAYIYGEIRENGEDAPAIFRFTNENAPFYMNIQKVWETEEPQDIEEVRICLQRRLQSADPSADDSWVNVTKDFFGNSLSSEDGDYITLSKDGKWQLESDKALPYQDEESGQMYVYRIQEMDVGTGKLSNYTVRYEEIRDDDIQDSDGNTYMKITYKAINRTQGLTITKKWEDSNDTDKVRPEKIRVFLQQSSDYDEEDPQKATWRYYNLETEETTEKDPDDSYYIELDKSNNWTKGIKGLPLLSGEEDSASSYYYRITGEQMYVDGQWVDIDRSDGNSYQAKYGDPVKPEETAVLNVTNTLEKGSVKILKQDSETSSLLKGASFKLERLVEETDNTDIEKWKVDESWKAKTGDTDGFGELVFKDLPYGSYKITEVKSPTGYVLLRKPIYVTINKEEFDKQAQEHQGDDSFDASLKTILVTVKNDKGLTVPGTGAGGTFMLTMAGLALMLGGAMLLYIRRVRSIRQSSRHSTENK